MRWVCFGSCISFLSVSILSLFAQDIDHLIQENTFIGNEKVLDYGCGEGDTSLQLAKVIRHGAVMGVDFAKKTIDLAKKKHLQAPSHLSFKHRDSISLDYQGEFDIISCFSPGQLLYRKDTLLAKFYKFLKPGGKVLAKVPKKFPTALETAFRKAVIKERWQEHFARFSPRWVFLEEGQIKNLVEASSFKTLFCKSFPTEYVFKNKESFIQFLKSWFQDVPIFSDKEKSLFFEDLAAGYLEIFPKDFSGKIHFLLENYEMVIQKV